MRLSIEDHDRGQAGLEYVYAVVSRRSRGLSLGINLNPNNACNWRCVYCQVPGLTHGNAPAIDLERLERELARMLRDAVDPAWLAAHVPEGSRTLRDIAISGNGEPTSARELESAIEIVGRELERHALRGRVELVLITNGSLVHLERVQAALRRLAQLGGRVWFKLDSATDAGQARINSNRAGVARTRRNLELCASSCPTWVQTMALDFGGPTLAGEELAAYCALLAELKARGVPLGGVLLYGLARASHQPEASALKALPAGELERLALAIGAATGLGVQVHP